MLQHQFLQLFKNLKIEREKSKNLQPKNLFIIDYLQNRDITNYLILTK
jgi:hypothetical protein